MVAKEEIKPKCRNPELVKGLRLFSKSQMYRKRGKWAIKAKHNGVFPHFEKTKSPTPAVVAKPPKFYPADDVRKRPQRLRRKQRITKLRSNITPGTVLIILDGKFIGRRVVFLKQLPSGLLLITGPFKINKVPLMRIEQAYVISTSTKIDISDVNLDKFDDILFSKKAERKKNNKKKKGEVEFFQEEKKEVKKVSEERREDQKTVDTPIIKAIESVEHLRAYIGTRFTLKDGMRPHLLVF